MREIKFRAWDTKEKKWYEPVHEAYKGNLHELLVSFSGQLSAHTMRGIIHQSMFQDRYILSQFTGHKEYCHDDHKQNKEIYDGDIVNLIDGIFLVEWNDDTCKFQYSDGSDINVGNRYGCYRQVIGNIYENPELLENK